MNILKSYECMNACILNHMNRAGMEINGSDIFFSGGGFPVSYKKGSLTRIVSDGYEANFRFLDQYGLDYKFGRVSPEKESLLSFLENSGAITIGMVSDFLTYDPVFSQTSGASHFINILKYDSNKMRFFIADGDVPSAETGTYLGWLDESDVLKGWEIKCGEIFVLKLPEGLDQKKLCQRVREEANLQVERSIRCYLEGKDHFWQSRSTGEKAISCMVKEMGKYVEKRGFRDITLDANFHLRVDGYMGAKKFLLEKLWEQGKTKLAEEYKVLIERWSKWCMLLLKSGLAATEENFCFVKQRMEELVQQEHQILEKY
ncbi:MAG: hypothetical protein HFJ06_12500 [Lachnospiraceae bacterium]|nr:hypothetical protein [Lachnospiraceae bacterium]